MVISIQGLIPVGGLVGQSLPERSCQVGAARIPGRTQMHPLEYAIPQMPNTLAGTPTNGKDSMKTS